MKKNKDFGTFFQAVEVYKTLYSHAYLNEKFASYCFEPILIYFVAVNV